MAGNDSAATSDVIAEVSQGIKDDPKNPTASADLKSALDDTVHVILSSRGKVEAYAYRTDSAENASTMTDAPRQRAATSWIEERLARHKLAWRKE